MELPNAINLRPAASHCCCAIKLQKQAVGSAAIRGVRAPVGAMGARKPFSTCLLLLLHPLVSLNGQASARDNRTPSPRGLHGRRAPLQSIQQSKDTVSVTGNAMKHSNSKQAVEWSAIDRCIAHQGAVQQRHCSKLQFPP